MERIVPGPGQESVWDYPRPPRVEPAGRRVRVEFNGETVADSRAAYRVLETSHPPTYYIPPADVRLEFLTPSPQRTFCEFKGSAGYWTLMVGTRVSREAAWSYSRPAQSYSMLRDYLAFYPGRVDACFVDDERVEVQEGDFYGGWITSNLTGPFKGGAGTRFW
ncbi:MAG TPA: DUF427 domain-containing protein [Bryobacteraceae bacterium]|nr:DUF427 domain-containing protein [Bryobacteraceae bacterium]